MRSFHCVSIICVMDTTESLLNSNYVLNFKEPIKVRTVSNSNLNQTSDLRNKTWPFFSNFELLRNYKIDFKILLKKDC